MRIVAGPNGSGKSTAVREVLPENLLGIYINPDDIQKGIREQGFADLKELGVLSSAAQAKDYLSASTFLFEQGLSNECSFLKTEDSLLYFDRVEENSYFVSVLCDFIRRCLISQGSSFTFETVMSHHDKVELHREARRVGYRTYLYFVSLRDVALNIERVRERTEDGGHDVPEDKIRERYRRAMDNLRKAILAANRSYLFDNSGDECAFFGEVEDKPRGGEGRVLHLHRNPPPEWFTRWVLNQKEK